MTVIFFLIAVGAVVAGGFLAAFTWAVRSGQFDDTTTPAVRVLLDDPRRSPSTPELRRTSRRA
jgi:cbb3-type cytochrome oxidase maturation protein